MMAAGDAATGGRPTCMYLYPRLADGSTRGGDAIKTKNKNIISDVD